MFKKFLCKIGFHTFDKWKVIKEGIIKYKNGDSRHVFLQERKCTICGITKRLIKEI